MNLVSTTEAARTYSFRGEHATWASCTVNDATGELLITSDWGNWSHRWDPSPGALGAPSLTAFIGTRGNVDYLARKLQGGGTTSGRRFSAEATARALRRLVCERRLEDGRRNAGQTPRLARSTMTDIDARRIWGQIGEVADKYGYSADLFFDRVQDIDGFAHFVAADPWEYTETEQTAEDRALREHVLPALIAACRGGIR